MNITPHKALIDGNKIPPQLIIPAEAIIGGDALIAEISAASILAKVTRDQQLIQLDKLYLTMVLPNTRATEQNYILKPSQNMELSMESTALVSHQSDKQIWSCSEVKMKNDINMSRYEIML